MKLRLIDGDDVGQVSVDPFQNRYQGDREEVNEIIESAREIEDFETEEPETEGDDVISATAAEGKAEMKPKDKLKWLQGHLRGVGIFTSLDS
jgi:hypothetical protein